MCQFGPGKLSEYLIGEKFPHLAKNSPLFPDENFTFLSLSAVKKKTVEKTILTLNINNSFTHHQSQLLQCPLCLKAVPP